MTFTVHERSYGVAIKDEEMGEIIAVEQADIPDLIAELQKYVPQKDVLEVVIMVRHPAASYVNYLWDCPMCTFRVLPDIQCTYVETTAISHLKNQHNIDINKGIQITYKVEGS